MNARLDQRSGSDRRERASLRSVLARPLAVAGAAAIAVGYLALVDPNQPGHYPSCPILWLSGRYCPGCGGLRAVHDLLQGQVSAAVSTNLVIVALIPIAMLVWARWVFLRSAVLNSESRWGRSLPPWSLWLLLVAVLLFWVLRNLPATAWLAP